MKSNNSNGQLTAQINLGDHKKSGFDLSNNVLGTGKIGRIIPTRALHVMPGDTIKADSKVAVQFEPLAVPILANMEVKQEHFYVPYNVVWKNWDKFISGGERMDYNGVVPSVTMRQIIEHVFGLFSLNFSLFFSEKQGSYQYISAYNNIMTSSDSTLDDQLKLRINWLNQLGDAYGIRDILQTQEEAYKLFSSSSLGIDKNNVENNVLFKLRTNSPTYVEEEINLWYDKEFNGNKYMLEIKEALINMCKEYQVVIIPTDMGIAYVSAMYEVMKSFVGLGSNIDYLNMGRLTLSELLYATLYYIVRAYAENVFPENDMFPLHIFNSDQGYESVFNNNPLSILHLRANYSVWYNDYRDILLETKPAEPYDGDEVTYGELTTLLVPRQRCWEKDSFTTALDNPGTGNVGVPVHDNFLELLENNSILSYDEEGKKGLDNDMQMVRVQVGDQEYRLPSSYLSGQNRITDSSEVFSGFSLHALDAAQRAQKWLQKALFFGNRISDFYYMRYGVRFLDARLRLPELLTSSSELVKLDVIMNNTNITTEAGGEVYQSVAGDRAAYASAYDNGNSFDRFCEEHGVIMSYLTIMPQITYAYGCSRDYSRLDQFDFAFAEFATLGMDSVYDSEITATSLNKRPEVFGYQGRYYDYKAKHSEEHGELLDTQDMYTFARKYNMFTEDGRPRLNYEFVHCFPDLDMFVVDSRLSDYFRYDVRHSTAAERGLPSQSIYI